MWHAPLGSVFCLHVSPLQVLRTDKLIEELSPNSSSTIRTHNTEGLASCKETAKKAGLGPQWVQKLSAFQFELQHRLYGGGKEFFQC